MYIARLILMSLCLLVIGFNSSNAQQPVQFVEDQDFFNSICTDLSFEDFEDTNLGPDTRAFCSGPLNNLTNNECYSPGALIPGFSFDSNTVPNVIVTTPPRSSFTNVAVSADFLSSAVIDFSDAVNAAGMSLVVARADELTAEVNVYGIGNTLLGTTTVDLTSTVGTFLGVVTEEPIERIEIIDDTGRLFPSLYDLSFGLCQPARPIPTFSEWGLISMAGVLGIIALLAVRRKRLQV